MKIQYTLSALIILIGSSFLVADSSKSSSTQPLTGIFKACDDGNLAEVRQALDEGARVDAVENDYTPLYYAVTGHNPNLEVVQFLLGINADPHVDNILSITAKAAIRNENKKAILEELLKSQYSTVEIEKAIEDIEYHKQNFTSSSEMPELELVAGMLRAKI